MCILLGLEIRTYSNMKCNNENKLVIENNSVLDTSYKFMFYNIFCHKYSDMINYKIIKDNGNFMTVILSLIIVHHKFVPF